MTLRTIDADNDETECDEMEALFHSCGLRTRHAPGAPSEVLRIIDEEDGLIIGAMLVHDAGGATPAMRFLDFTIAVHPDHRRRGSASLLIASALELAPPLVQPFFAGWCVHVINPYLARLLAESFDFDYDGRRWSPDSPHLIRHY